MDADLSVPTSEIPKLLDALEEGADIAIGSRNLPESELIVRPPYHRIVLGRTFNFLFRHLFHVKIYDTQCGFKAIKANVLRELVDMIMIEGFAFDINLIVEAIKNNYKITEVPIAWEYRKGSKVNTFKQAFIMARDLSTIYLETKKRELKIPQDELLLKKFYDSIPGDSYWKAKRSGFIPRRLWHDQKNTKIMKTIPAESVDALDAGFGSGTIIQSLKERDESLNIYGIDLGKEFVEFAHNKYGHEQNVNLLNSDVKYLPFREETVDIVVCSEVIEHIYKPEKIVLEFQRILKHGGKVIITTPNCSFRWSLLEAIWTRFRREMLETNHRAFTKQRLKFLLSKHDFENIFVEPFMFGCLLLVTANKPQNDTSLPTSEIEPSIYKAKPLSVRTHVAGVWRN